MTRVQAAMVLTGVMAAVLSAGAFGAVLLDEPDMQRLAGGCATYHCQTDWQCEYVPDPGDPGYGLPTHSNYSCNKGELGYCYPGGAECERCDWNLRPAPSTYARCLNCDPTKYPGLCRQTTTQQCGRWIDCNCVNVVEGQGECRRDDWLGCVRYYYPCVWP